MCASGSSDRWNNNKTGSESSRKEGFLMLAMWMRGLRPWWLKGQSSSPPDKQLAFSCRVLSRKGVKERKPLSPVLESLNSFPKGSFNCSETVCVCL